MCANAPRLYREMVRILPGKCARTDNRKNLNYMAAFINLSIRPKKKMNSDQTNFHRFSNRTFDNFHLFLFKSVVILSKLIQRRLYGNCLVCLLAFNFLVGQNWLLSVLDHLEKHQSIQLNEETKNQASNRYIFRVLGRL